MMSLKTRGFVVAVVLLLLMVILVPVVVVVVAIVGAVAVAAPGVNAKARASHRGDVAEVAAAVATTWKPVAQVDGTRRRT